MTQYLYPMKPSLAHQSDGKLFPLIAATTPLMVRAFWRKIYVHNRRAVPHDKPVLLAANHPTAFLDPVILCSFLDPPLYNMTRGDIFQKPFFRRLLESINMFPVFRQRDGYTGRDRNDEVFEFCREKLRQKRVLAIYVEGEHHLEWRVKPVQKGIIRIAFDALEKYDLPDLQIIPAGCNHVWGDRPRDEIMVNIGEPIPLAPYWAEYRQNPGAAAARLTTDIGEALKKICLHVADPADDQLAAQLLTLRRSDFSTPLLPIVEFHNRRFLAEKAVCDRINAMPQAEKNALREKTDPYFAALEQAGLSDGALANPRWAAWRRLPLFLLGFLPFLAGYLGSYPIIGLARYLTRKKVKKREFRSSVHLGVAYLASVAFYALYLLAGLLSRDPWWIALSLALPALGWFSMFYRENWSRWFNARRALGRPERSRLLRMREEIAAP